MEWRQPDSVCNHLTMKVKCKGDTLLMLHSSLFSAQKKSLQQRDENAFDLIDLLPLLHLLPLSKKSILDYFSECWLSNEPQSRQDVCDNDDRG